MAIIIYIKSNKNYAFLSLESHLDICVETYIKVKNAYAEMAQILFYLFQYCDTKCVY